MSKHSFSREYWLASREEIANFKPHEPPLCILLPHNVPYLGFNHEGCR